MEQSLQCVEQSVGRAGLSLVAEGFQRRVQQFIHQAIERLADFFLRPRVHERASFEFMKQSLQFRFFQLGGIGLEPPDGRSRGAVVQFGHEASGLFVDDVLRFGPFFRTRFAIRFAGLSQVVNAIQIDAQAVANGRIEIRGMARSRTNRGR